MRRRIFLSKTIHSSIAVSVSTSAIGTFLRPEENVISWWHQLRRKVDTPLFSFILSDSNIDTAIDKVDQLVAIRGFVRMQSQPLFYHDKQNCLVPFILRRKAVSEILLAAFQKSGSGTWENVTMLNGFELEAILQIAENNSMTDQHFIDLLLPVKQSTGTRQPAKFSSKLSKVHIHTRIEGTSVKTHISLQHPSLDLQFESAHCLNVKSILI